MKVARSVAEVLAEHTTLTLECIDRMYLNVYVPLLKRAAGAAYFFCKMRGAAVPSSALMAPMTQRFVDAIKSFATRNGIEIVAFRRGERKDDGTRQYLRDWPGGEGVVYIGKTQEKARVVRTERRHDPTTGDTYPWLAASTASSTSTPSTTTSVGIWVCEAGIDEVLLGCAEEAYTLWSDLHLGNPAAIEAWGPAVRKRPRI